MTRRDLVLHTPLALLLLSSCARLNYEALRPMLNSERIFHLFGSYGIEVLERDARVRVSNLYSLEGSHKVCRTFAVVFFPPAVDPHIAAEHREILAGGSIGAVFKRAGFRVEKRHRYFGELPRDRHRGRLHQLMGQAAYSALAIHIYDMVLHKNSAETTYATIAEVHHPAFLELHDLEGIYGAEVPQHARPDADARRILEQIDAELHESQAELDPAAGG